MSESPPDAGDTMKPTAGSIEADIAFFDARRALLSHEPDTAYKRAQLKICDVMQQTLQDELQQLKRQHKNPDNSKQ